MGPKAHFIFALIFFFIGRKYSDNIFFFISIYSVVIGISALVHRLSISAKKRATLESSEKLNESNQKE